MEKNSVVKNVTGNGTFEWQGKMFYKFEVTFENGDTGDYNSISQEQNKFVVGQNVSYTIDNKNPNYPKIKPVYASPGGGFTPRASNPEKDKLIVKQVCLKVSAEMVGKNDPTAVIKTASILLNWVMNDETPAVVKKQKKETTSHGDLPF